MGKLFLDDFVKRQGFNSTGEHIAWCLQERIPPRFSNVRYYMSLWKEGLIREGFSIRTSNESVIG